MKHRFWKIAYRGIVSICTVVLLASPLSFVRADTEQDIEDAKNRINDYQNAISEVNRIIQESEAQKADLEGYIREMDALSVELNDHLRDLALAKSNTEAQIEVQEARLQEQEALEREQYEAMKLRIQYMYEFGNVTWVDIFLGAGSVSDLYNQVMYVAEVEKYDRKKLLEYKETVNTIQETKEELEQAYALLVAEEAEFEENIAAVETVLATKQTEMVNLNQEIAAKEQAIGDFTEAIDTENDNLIYLEYRLEQEAEAAKQAAIEAAKEAARIAAEAAMKEALESSIAESASIEASIAEAESIQASIDAANAASEASLEGDPAESSSSFEGNSSDGSSVAEETTTGSPIDGTTTGGSTTTTTGTSTSTGGPSLSLTWPCPGYERITSTFGPRPDAPVAGVALYHNAIDIAADLGATIVAADDGIVIYAGDGEEVASTAGGYQVWIAHKGGTYITMYMHCSKLIAKKGDSVQAGDVIAEVGNTGLSAGCHLDFRILYGEHYIDPLGSGISYRK